MVGISHTLGCIYLPTYLDVLCKTGVGLGGNLILSPLPPASSDASISMRYCVERHIAL